MALKRIDGKTDIHLIHHSDRGCQYASSEYIKLLNDNHILISMTESGDPKDNAQAERINNTMKNELLKGMRFTNIDEVIAAVARAVDFYNNERPHMSIDMMTPAMGPSAREKSKSVGSVSVNGPSGRSKLWKSLKIVYLCPTVRGSFRATPSSQPLTGIRPGKTTKNRDNDESQPLPVITLNQSQLLSGIDSNQSQPKSRNDIGSTTSASGISSSMISKSASSRMDTRPSTPLRCSEK